jgi:hypothetical protein
MFACGGQNRPSRRRRLAERDPAAGRSLAAVVYFFRGSLSFAEPLYAHAQPSDAHPLRRPPPPTPNQPPANPNAPLPGYGNLSPAYVVPTWHSPLAQARYAETRAANYAVHYVARANRANAPPQQHNLTKSIVLATTSSPGFTVTDSIFY